MTGLWWPWLWPWPVPAWSMVGYMQTVGNGPVTVGSAFTSGGGGGGGGSSNTFISSIGEFNTNWIGVGLILTPPPSPSTQSARQTTGSHPGVRAEVTRRWRGDPWRPC